MPNFEPMLDNDFNQLESKWALDLGFPNQSLNGPFCDSENIDLTTGSSHFDFNLAMEVEQPQNSFGMPMDDANMPSDLTWLPRNGVDLLTATSSDPAVLQSGAGRECDTTESLKIGPNHLPKERTTHSRKPSVARRVLMPTSTILAQMGPGARLYALVRERYPKKSTCPEGGKQKSEGFCQ